MGGAAAGIGGVAVEDELGVAVGDVGLGGEELGPGGLDVVEDEGDEFDFGGFGGVEGGVGLAAIGGGD